MTKRILRSLKETEKTRSRSELQAIPIGVSTIYPIPGDMRRLEWNHLKVYQYDSFKSYVTTVST